MPGPGATGRPDRTGPPLEASPAGRTRRDPRLPLHGSDRRRTGALSTTRLATVAVAALAASIAVAPSDAPLPAAAVSLLRSLRINTSHSLPRGLYRLVPLARPPRPGDLVLACPPPAATALARQRGYLGRGPCPGGSKPLGKLVLAAAGDRLELAPTGLVLNRCALPSSATLPSDPSGRRLPHPAPGAYKVTAAQVWLFSPHPRSFDSRYFGPIAVTQLQGLLRPLVVLPAAAMRRWASRLRACAAAP